MHCHVQAAQALALLQWLAAELGQLPQAQQREALQLPLQLGGKLTSRVLARGLRAVLLPAQSPAKAAPSVSFRAEDDVAAPPARSAVSRVQSPRYAGFLPPRPILAEHAVGLLGGMTLAVLRRDIVGCWAAWS